jgi:glycosyltransferase involved in cell wall biosynthesis
MSYKYYLLKRKIENIFISPLIGIGKLIFLITSHKKSYELYFFFPFYHLGGAEKVHLQIAKLAKEKKAVIVFTRKSNNEGFLNAFKTIGIDIEEASSFTNNDLFRLPINIIARGYYAARINKDQAMVFNGQSNFGYKIAPWVNSHLQQFELIHSFNSFSWIRIPFANYYTKTVMISQQKIQEHILQYDQINAPANLKDRIIYIPNAVEPSSTTSNKQWEKPFKVVYVGRGSEEKRIASIIEVAKKAKETNLPFEFELIGDVHEFIPSNANNYVAIPGMINDKALLNAKYAAAHFVLLLSSTEGMPLVILEAMQDGCIPIVTKVGDLPFVIDETNGYLVDNEEASVIQDTYEKLVSIAKLDTAQMEILSNNSIKTIADNYSLEQFNSNYRQLLEC